MFDTFRLAKVIKKGGLNEMKKMIKGDDIFSDEDFSQALHITLKHETLELDKVKCLLDAGASVLYTLTVDDPESDLWLFTPVMTKKPEQYNCLKSLVSVHDNVDCIKLLLDHCPEDKQAQLIDGNQSCHPDALHTSIDRGFENSAVEILKTRMKVNWPTTELMQAGLGTADDDLETGAGSPKSLLPPTWRIDLMEKAARKNMTSLVSIFMECPYAR